MSYKLRYTAEWKDVQNNINQVYIYKDTDDTVVSEQIKIVTFDIDYPETDFFNDESLIGCGANITLISENRLKFIEELYTIKKQELKLIHKVNSVINFVGWIDTEQYEDEFSNFRNYPISISANNGFNILDRIVIGNQSEMEGVISVYDLIRNSLLKLNHNYSNLYIGISTTVPEYTILNNQTLLHKMFVKTENLFDEKGIAMSTREVINNVLVSLSAKFYIEGNSVFIVDINTMNDSNLVVKSFDYLTGVYTKDINIPNISSITKMIGNYTLTRKSGVNNANIKFNKYCYSWPIDVYNYFYFDRLK